MKQRNYFIQRILPIGLVLTFVASTLIGCQHLSTDNHNESTSVNQSFEQFTNDLFIEELSSNIINLHYSVETPAAIGISDYEISLGDFSAESRAASTEILIETKSELEKFSYDKLSLENQLTYDVLLEYLDMQIALCEYDLYQEPLSFSGGLQMQLPILYAEYEFKNEQDVKDYLEMIALTDEYFDQLLDFEAEKSSNSLFMSEDLCELVIKSCESFLLDKENHYLISTFELRLESLDLSPQKKASYSRQNEAILEKQLFPAYETMILRLNQLKCTGVNPNGVCYYKNGKKYYEYLVHSETGSQENIDAMFRRIENQRLLDLLACNQLQESDDSVIEACKSLNWSIEDPNIMLTKLQSAMLDDFESAPDCTYVINYVTPALENYLAPAFYIVAPLDNYKENVIYINNGYISSDIYAFTTLAHEGYPGHLYQTVMTYTYDFPNIRTILNYNGYVEGWATYVEMMSYYYAGLDENVASFLSHNQAATLSLYASSDIGIHYYGWTDEEMYDFWAGYGITNESTIKEITQLIRSEPGNYLKYYVGYIEFLKLKDYAKDLFGSDYSDKQFHKAILDIGPASFSILEKYLPKYYSPQT